MPAAGRLIKLGVAQCLLGEKVRYDGKHKLDHYLRDVLGRYFEFVPVCPEVEAGMGVPREAVHLSGSLTEPKLVGVRSGRDWTQTMLRFGRERVAALERENLCALFSRASLRAQG